MVGIKMFDIGSLLLVIFIICMISKFCEFTTKIDTTANEKKITEKQEKSKNLRRVIVIKFIEDWGAYVKNYDENNIDFVASRSKTIASGKIYFDEFYGTASLIATEDFHKLLKTYLEQYNAKNLSIKNITINIYNQKYDSPPDGTYKYKQAIGKSDNIYITTNFGPFTEFEPEAILFSIESLSNFRYLTIITMMDKTRIYFRAEMSKKYMNILERILENIYYSIVKKQGQTQESSTESQLQRYDEQLEITSPSPESPPEPPPLESIDPKLSQKLVKVPIKTEHKATEEDIVEKREQIAITPTKDTEIPEPKEIETEGPIEEKIEIEKPIKEIVTEETLEETPSVIQEETQITQKTTETEAGYGLQTFNDLPNLNDQIFSMKIYGDVSFEPDENNIKIIHFKTDFGALRAVDFSIENSNLVVNATGIIEKLPDLEIYCKQEKTLPKSSYISSTELKKIFVWTGTIKEAVERLNSSYIIQDNLKEITPIKQLRVIVNHGMVTIKLETKLNKKTLTTAFNLIRELYSQLDMMAVML